MIFAEEIISTKLVPEIFYFMEKFRKADYTLRFVNNIVKNLIQQTRDLESPYIIPASLFKELKLFVYRLIYLQTYRYDKNFFQNLTNFLALNSKSQGNKLRKEVVKIF